MRGRFGLASVILHHRLCTTSAPRFSLHPAPHHGAVKLGICVTYVFCTTPWCNKSSAPHHIRKQAKRPRKHTSQRKRPNRAPIKISQPNRRNIIKPTHATPFHNTTNIKSALVFAVAVDYMKKIHNSSLVRINHWAPSGHMGPAEYVHVFIIL